MMNDIRVGITMGDPSGIGPSIIAQALPKVKDLADFIIIGDRGVFNKLRITEYGLRNTEFIDLNNVQGKKFSFGKIRAEYGRAAIEYLDEAMELLKDKSMDCLVTCPISKEAIRLAGFKYSGHTEYLAEKTNAKEPVMMLLNKQLKISLVTRHIPLRDVPLALNSDRISKTILVSYQGLKRFFAIKNPRIVVCGLNPHASDNGIIGNEENKVIKPVLKRLRDRVGYLCGPESADVAMYKTTQGRYDCVIAMYHDQALIPLKVLNINSGLNLTLGLPFVRTAPLHGTAFDIANTKLGDPASLIEAIKLAVKCTQNLKRA